MAEPGCAIGVAALEESGADFLSQELILLVAPAGGFAEMGVEAAAAERKRQAEFLDGIGVQRVELAD